MIHAAITGVGEFRPPHVRTNDDWPASFVETQKKRPNALTRIVTDETDVCAEIVRRHAETELGDPFVGTRERRIASSEETSVVCQAHAAKAALDDAGVGVDELDFVLSQAHPPDRPGLPGAPWIMQRLGITRAVGLDVDAACASSVSHLQIASALIQSGQARHVLVTQGHVITRATPMTHPASPNVGDVATAMVVSRADEPGILSHHAETHAEFVKAFAWLRPCNVEPGLERPWWNDGGAFQFGSMDGKVTEQLIAGTVRIARDTLLEACRKADVAPESLGLLCSVQPRRWIPAAIAEACGMTEGRAPNTFCELAHVGACGPVVNLLAARRAKRLKRGDVLAFYAQGAGLTRVSSVVRWSKSD
jgi:3-oxoacyl-[acyl-carrier-protein] synthase III